MNLLRYLFPLIELEPSSSNNRRSPLSRTSGSVIIGRGRREAAFLVNFLSRLDIQSPSMLSPERELRRHQSRGMRDRTVTPRILN